VEHRKRKGNGAFVPSALPLTFNLCFIIFLSFPPIAASALTFTKIQDPFCYCLLLEQQEWAQEGFTTTKRKKIYIYILKEEKQGADCVSDLPFCSTSILSVGRENERSAGGKKRLK